MILTANQAKPELTQLSRKVAGTTPDEVIGFFQLTWSFQPHYGHGVNSASNRNEYRESSWG
jgi:hypothetical protein